MSDELIFGGAPETLGFGGAFLVAIGGAGAVTTGVLADIPASPKVVEFDPADVRRGIRVGIS